MAWWGTSGADGGLVVLCRQRRAQAGGKGGAMLQVVGQGTVVVRALWETPVRCTATAVALRVAA
eukprot:5412121-Pleurochrysis_carterae.AAC.1